MYFVEKHHVCLAGRQDANTCSILTQIDRGMFTPELLRSLEEWTKQALLARDFSIALWGMGAAAEILYQYGDVLYPEETLEEKSSSVLAKEQAQAALTLAKEIADTEAEAHLYALLALLALDTGRSKDAHDHLLDALACFSLLGDQEAYMRVLRWYAEHLDALGAKEEAAHALSLLVKNS